MTPEEYAQRVTDTVAEWTAEEFSLSRLAQLVTAAICAAIAEDREACATLVERAWEDDRLLSEDFQGGQYANPDKIAAALRARSHHASSI